MDPTDLSALPEEGIAKGEEAAATTSSSPSLAFDQAMIPTRPYPRNLCKKYAPLDWSGYFNMEEDVKIPELDDAFHVYLAGSEGPVVFYLHGGGYLGAVGDTCTAMDQWVLYPHAETALSNILPCVDERTTNQTLYQSKDVIRQLVNIVNTAIWTVANSNSPPQSANSFSYNQSGPLMPTLCSPFDSQLHSRQCDPYEVSFDNASMVWQNYTCAVSESGSCISPGRITPNIYDQLVAAVNVSYALDHYAPLLLNLQDCAFVRQTFNSITTYYCPDLQHGLKMVNIGLALISIGVMLCLILWIVYANRPRREEVFVTTLSEAKVSSEKR